MYELSIIIPAFNEATRIAPTLLSIHRFLSEREMSYEIIVVDDGSTDDTVHVVNELKEQIPQVTLIQLPMNKGKGHAVKVGMLSARGTACLFTDADGSTPIESLELLVRPILDNNSSISIGSRYLDDSIIGVPQPWYRRKWSRLSNRIIQKLLLPGIVDPHCGFKVFEQNTAKLLFSQSNVDGWSFDLEILSLARSYAIQIMEFPVHWNNDDQSKGRLRHLPREIASVYRIRRRMKAIA